MDLFDRAALRRNRVRAARGFAAHDFLFSRAARDIVERLAAMDEAFPLALDLGCRSGNFRRALASAPALAERIGTLVETDLDSKLLPEDVRHGVVASEELLPFADASVSLIVSVLALHAANDLPGALIQARRTLKPDGVFLAALFGEETLSELRQALMQAESEIDGGLSPRVAPFVTLADAGALLQRAGFFRPVADVDRVRVRYPGALALMGELRAMGEANALAERRRVPLKRAVLARACAIYHERFADTGGRVPATFDILFLTGFAPSRDQTAR
jgi:SAM-dependent methyltransferase